ncbi:selenocysteine-specific translation elongation factor [Paucibacter sp. R3-3]|uniref:Selenocysteine-specific elongation factor n=1 Tax=Roseateles agri TaxID=3098619 RepID=A0ABU5DR78_9BURK|nr:selenocysteine-specific translation elongation factor [Paucibacter sp. R3-3]MDY0748216.1 selenocysteine-specific translation elongation factor [Paucibacter sp. R3-3]
MIVGTAGHIDHGKTTLVRALTGVDTDRLPEEKKRGISIELGYAFLDDPNSEARIGFVDVPGHERFVHTMLAGATGIDYALLLVAADDGVMPQTREHLAVLSLLGLSRGALVITKADRATPERLAAVQAELEALRAGSSLSEAPILQLSATTGEGLDALRTLLFAEASSPRQRPLDAAFRLAVDRSFSLDGVGTVVTGSIHAGRVSVGDELVLSPDPQARRLRVRSLHAHNRLVATAHAGQRCALGLVGIAKDEIARGQWLSTPDAALASDRIDLRLKLWPGEPRPLRSGTPVHAHIGARAVTGTVALLDADTLQPGGEALAQLLLREPIGAWRGDRVVLRDASASRTMAGGTVLDPFAPQRYRRTPARLAELRALHEATSPAERLQALLDAAPLGLDLRRFAVAEGLKQDLAPDGDAALLAGDWALSAAHATVLAQQVQDRLADFHARQPDELGPEASRLRRLVAPRLPEPLWRALLARGREQGLLAQRGAFVHLQAHGVELSALESRIAQKVAPLLAAAGFDGAWVRDLARDTQEAETLMRATLARLAQQGDVHQIVKDLYCGVAEIAKMAALVRELAGQNREAQVSAAGFRDATGLGRKRAIQVLEYFDRVGLLRRVGDVHRLRGEADLFA